MAETLTTRPLVADDVDEVLEVMRAALGETALLERTHELFSWKHFDNPFGESIAMVATAGDRIVGLRTFMRWRLRTPGGDMLDCVRAVDTATHPEFHRRGIFRRLTEEAVEVATAQGVHLIFNTPNPKSGSGYLSMGWEEVGEIGVLARPTRRFLGALRPRPDRVVTIDAPPAKEWTRAPLDRPARGLRTPRTEAYLTWRYVAHPTARYHVVQSGPALGIVRPNVRKGRSELLISDLFGRKRHKAISRAVGASRASYVAASFTSGSPERAACRRAGLMPVPRYAALTLVARPLQDLDIDVTSLTSWDLALGDLELL